MKTKILRYLLATACPNFRDWSEDSNLAYFEQQTDDWTSFVVSKADVYACTKESEYLKQLKHAFLANPSFEEITLDIS